VALQRLLHAAVTSVLLPEAAAREHSQQDKEHVERLSSAAPVHS